MGRSLFELWAGSHSFNPELLGFGVLWRCEPVPVESPWGKPPLTVETTDAWLGTHEPMIDIHRASNYNLGMCCEVKIDPLREPPAKMRWKS